ncbi:non-heme iron oxygenase ferredoxin subunit [Paraburkholderia caribensis]|uniref:non-heme iron oxygenase ferredoxin subunit n=1 Tax=Paraburkholderia caribensis TaxID=75105 RepID=UPI001CAF7C96|nr:non-heme iron oxygenase ferredoxin subunit [Paraburkholderia caribensis]CAG9262954.1 3-phenylpropionate/cinnamic acid dioxygenase ferredoxin subunit [Paraburkholderia caribensis]
MNTTLKRLIGIDQLENGVAKKVCVAGVAPIAVYKCGDEYFATQDKCTHAQASLSEGWVEGFEVFCPVHDARFDIRDGRALCFPATEPLATYKVVLEGGYVSIEVGEAGDEVR